LSVANSLFTQISSASHTQIESMNFVLEKTQDLTSYKKLIFFPLWKKMQNVAFFFGATLCLPSSLNECGLILFSTNFVFSPGGWSCCQERAASTHRNCTPVPIL